MDRETREALAQERAARAERIRRLWEEEGLDAVQEQWEAALTEALLKTDARQDMERYRLQTAILMGRKLKDWMLSMVRDGELARRELKEIRSGKRGFH